MALWMRNAIMILVVLIWAVYILIELLERGTIDPLVWGFPGVLYYALNPLWQQERTRKKKRPRDEDDDDEDEGRYKNYRRSRYESQFIPSPTQPGIAQIKNDDEG